MCDQTSTFELNIEKHKWIKRAWPNRTHVRTKGNMLIESRKRLIGFTEHDGIDSMQD